MKRITYLLITLAVVAIGCTQKEHGAFVVTGKITNAPGKKLLLMEIPFSSPEPVILDSTSLGKKGNFTLRANASEEGIYRLVIQNGPDVLLINDGKSIRINMDVNDYMNYEVEGSPASSSLKELFHIYRKDDSTLLASYNQLDTLQRQPGQDSLVTVARMERDDRMKEMNNHLKSFIEKSQSPAASFYAIGLASRTLPPAELKPYVDAAAKQYPEHSGIARIKSLLTQQMATAAAPEYKLLNQQAPDLQMENASGGTLSINSFKGKYVLVDFWASWCGPCRAENPNLVEAYNKYRNKNFTILGVSLDQEKEPWLQAIVKDKLAWPQMSDLKMWESAAINAYQFDAIPFNVLIDPQGKIIAHSLRGTVLQNKLAEVLK